MMATLRTPAPTVWRAMRTARAARFSGSQILASLRRLRRNA